MIARVHCLSTAVTRITHGAGTAGNESIIVREKLIHDGAEHHVPAISGNQLRNRLVRNPGYRWLIDRLGLAGTLTVPQLNSLLSGGNLTESTAREPLERTVRFRRLFPLGNLLGGCLPDQQIPGRLEVREGRLVCAENAGRIAAELPAGWAMPGASLRPARHFLGHWTGYRYDVASGSTTDLELADPEALAYAERLRSDGLAKGEAPAERGHRFKNGKAQSQMMPHGGECLVPGSAFWHSFVLRHVGEREVGALLLSLRLWRAGGGTVGGGAARGHGVLATRLFPDPAVDEDAAISAYIDHCDRHKAECAAWLAEAFAAKPKDRPAPTEANGDGGPKRGRKKKAAAGEDDG